MNNCRAGLYSFAPTETWLRKIGVASPPYLVMLGLGLPDSRMLSGIAGIGLTLANIAIILPYLRQTILSGIVAAKGTLVHEQGTREQEPSLGEFDIMPPTDGDTKISGSTLVSSCDNEHQSEPLILNTTAKSSCPLATESLDANSEVVLPMVPLTSARNTEHNRTPPRVHLSPYIDFAEGLIDSNHLLTREGRSAFYVPLPVPDEAEVDFFDSLSNHDIDLEEIDILSEKGSITDDDEWEAAEGAQLTTAHISSTMNSILSGEFINVTMPVADENVPPKARPTLQGVQAEHSVFGNKDDFSKQHPESLKFVPQSVITRYPSVLMPAGRCIGDGRHTQFTSTTRNSVLSGGATMQSGYVVSEGPLCTVLLTAVQPNRKEQTAAFDTIPIKAKDLLSSPELQISHEIAPAGKRASHSGKRRQGVLARAALRDRRFAALLRSSSGTDSSSASDSGSEPDSDTQYSSGSSADESMLPHMLGADLLAAIDANSESGLNLVGTGRPMHAPLGMCEDSLISDNSTADVSMAMQVSSNSDSSESGARVAVTLRSLTYEDIQQWASGVVQKCVRQVCRVRAPVEPLSPSQVSDVCAEKPSGSGISRCPLSGLHCKLGAASLGRVPVPRVSEVSVSPTLVLPARKAIPLRNIRDIPEFVPRQQHVSITTGKIEGSSRCNTRSAINHTREAATKVIARLENQAGFNSRQGGPWRAKGRVM